MKMKTTYYRVQNSGIGAYDFRHDGTILAVRGDKEWLLTDEWCGGDIEGQCYRQHVDGNRKSWPKSAEKAIDKTKDFSDMPIGVFISDFSAKEIREMLHI